jgi:hypothetical protein
MDGISIPGLLQSHSPKSTRFSQKAIALMRDEASLFHHYTVHIGRWLDYSSAPRILTLEVPEIARQCPILGCVLGICATMSTQRNR